MWELFLNLIKNVLTAAISGEEEQDWHASDVFSVLHQSTSAAGIW